METETLQYAPPRQDIGRSIFAYAFANIYIKLSCEQRSESYPGPGLEPGPLAFRANALPLSYPGQVRVHDRINLFRVILSNLRANELCCYYVP